MTPRLDRLSDLARAWPWLLACVVFTAITAVMYPQQVGLLLWRLNVLSLAVWLGYWADRALFPYGRPHTLRRHSRTLAEIRRAIIVAALVIAAGMMP